MAKNPVLPLYYNDLTTSTQDWTDEEFGAYVRLLIHQWRQGYLPNDYQRLTRLATSLDTTWSLLKPKFIEVNGVLKNPYMEEVREKKRRHSEKQKANVQNRYQTTTKHITKPLPLEREIELEKEDWIKWGEQILNCQDVGWEAMRGRAITHDELDDFISVAIRNEWSMKTQQDFRRTLKGFKSTTKTNLNGAAKIVNDKLKSDAIIKARLAAKAAIGGNGIGGDQGHAS